MRTKNIKVCNAVHIQVDCAENDSQDIKCGGPGMLGYDFYISPDENVNKVVTQIKKLLAKYKRPLIEIKRHVEKDFNVQHLWTLEKIENCIKEENVC